MKIAIDAQSPVPLYHQIVETIRYRIATGELKPGVRLPSVRAAAVDWSVHLHTVRRAYAELAELELVEVRRPGGTTVLASLGGHNNRSLSLPLHRDVAGFLRRVRKKHGITAKQVCDLIRLLESPSESQRQIVTVVECNMPQAKDYARQLESTWAISAVAWSLDTPGDPLPGPIVSTFFHYNDVRARWPERVDNIHFVAVQPDPKLVDQVSKVVKTRGRTTVILGETDVQRAKNMFPDLKRALKSDRFRVELRIVKSPSELFNNRCRMPVVLAPRLWAQLSDRDRKAPNAIELRYLLQLPEIDALAHQLGWRQRVDAAARATSA